MLASVTVVVSEPSFPFEEAQLRTGGARTVREEVANPGDDKRPLDVLGFSVLPPLYVKLL
jgi:hypothetical protein